MIESQEWKELKRRAIFMVIRMLLAFVGMCLLLFSGIAFVGGGAGEVSAWSSLFWGSILGLIAVLGWNPKTWPNPAFARKWDVDTEDPDITSPSLEPDVTSPSIE